MSLKFEKRKNIGKIIGFLFSYLFFTFVLYFVLLLFGKINKLTGIFSVFLITLSIVFLGSLLKAFLK